MKSKDVILQVADETAEVMEAISEQLFDETDARFDEIAESIEESVEKIEKLYAGFSGYTETSDKRSKDNQAEVISKFKGLLDGLDDIKNESKEDSARVEEKVAQLITITSKLPGLIKTISEEIGEASQSSKEADEVIIDAIRTLSESLLKVQEMQTFINEKINTGDVREKLSILLEKLSETEKGIRAETIAVGRMSEILDRYGIVLDRLASSMETSQNSADKILSAEEANADSIKKLAGRSSETSAELMDKIGEVLSGLDALSTSVRSISERQAEICIQQDRFEADVKYLKLPFYKRWFTKG